MPRAETVGGAASAFGDFMQGVLQGKSQKNQQEAQEREERQARVGQLFSTAEKMRQDAISGKFKGPEQDRLYEQAQSLWGSAMQLSGQLDDKPAKAGKKQNPFMQFLSVLNPYSDSSRPRGEFDENFSKIVSAMGPGMGMGMGMGAGAPGAGAPGAGAPGAGAPDAAAQIADAMAPGGAVPGDRGMSTPQGEVGPFSAAAAPTVGGSAVPGDRGMSTPEGEVGPFSTATATQGLAPRPTSILNADGTRSSERSITVEVAELNGGRPTNIPTIYDGQQVTGEQAIQRAVQSGGVDRETGRRFPGFNSKEEAEAAAGQRSDDLGRLGAGAAPGAAAPGAAAPGGLPATLGAPEGAYTSPYFSPDEAVVERQKFAQLTGIYTALRASFAAKGIKSVDDLQKFPQGKEIVQHLMFLAAADDFDGFDELDEVYAGLGIQAARTPKNQFDDDYYRLARRAAGQGEPLDDQEQLNFARMRRLRRTGSDRQLSPADQMFENAKVRNTNEAGEIDMETAYAEWTKTTAKSGTQGYASKVGINPDTQRTEVMMVNNRTGDITWPGIEVASDFTFDKIMTRNAYGQGSFMDFGKIRFFYDRGDFSYEALNWFLQDMPDQISDPITDNLIDNPEREKLREFIETLPDPTEIATIREFATAWNADPANAAPDRQISFEEARDKMRSIGLPVGGSAIAAWRGGGGGG